MTDFLARDWKVLNDNVRADLVVVRIGHWNVLADQLAESGGFQPEPPSLAWPERSQRLLAIIDAAGPFDALSLVECDHFADFWEPMMRARGLVGWHARKTIHRWDHGVALFYRSDKFVVGQLRLFQDGVAAISAKLQLRHKPAVHFSLTTMHLKAKPDGEDTRDTQIANIGREMEIHDFNGIVVGDFNAIVTDNCVATLRRMWLVRPDFWLPWTTWKQRQDTVVRRAIDHVLMRNVFVTAFLDVPNDDDVTAAGLLPGTRYASDHLLLAFDCAL